MIKDEDKEEKYVVKISKETISREKKLMKRGNEKKICKGSKRK